LRRVILNALNYPYRRLQREEALARLAHATQLDTARPFVLHVGSNLRRKNRQCVVRAFARASREADLQLVLAGKPPAPELQELLRSEGVADRVTVVAKPSNEVLEALYNTALALFFPSRYEGFGWPLIEAQACGCPVICSRCAPFAEVVGPSALVRDADDECGFAEDILRLARDAAERDAWAAASLRNAARFAPAPMILQYLDVYRELAER
jgi:glycosyltransferase involved in cell wall biosynthesis